MFQPMAIAPVVVVEVGHQGGLKGSHLVLETIGIGFLVAVTLLATDFIFVTFPRLEPRHKQFPATPQPLL